MTSLNNMSKSSTRGIFLSITLLFTLALITIPAYADEINVKSTSLEETTIIELSNDSDDEVNTFRIWLGSDFSFESFKTEKGWMAEKTPQGVIIFTSTDPIKSGESVKFGEGNVVIANTVINSGTVVGDACVVNPDRNRVVTRQKELRIRIGHLIAWENSCN